MTKFIVYHSYWKYTCQGTIISKFLMGGLPTSVCSSAYPLKFAKVNYHIKFNKKLLEVFAICLFKLLI